MSPPRTPPPGPGRRHRPSRRGWARTLPSSAVSRRPFPSLALQKLRLPEASPFFSPQNEYLRFIAPRKEVRHPVAVEIHEPWSRAGASVHPRNLRRPAARRSQSPGPYSGRSPVPLFGYTRILPLLNCPPRGRPARPRPRRGGRAGVARGLRRDRPAASLQPDGIMEKELRRRRGQGDEGQQGERKGKPSHVFAKGHGQGMPDSGPVKFFQSRKGTSKKREEPVPKKGLILSWRAGGRGCRWGHPAWIAGVKIMTALLWIIVVVLGLLAPSGDVRGGSIQRAGAAAERYPERLRADRRAAQAAARPDPEPGGDGRSGS